MTLQPIYLHTPGHNFDVYDIHTIFGMLVLKDGREFDADCPTDLYVGTRRAGRYTAKQLVGKIEKLKERLPEAQEVAKGRRWDMRALGVITIGGPSYQSEVARIAKEIIED